MTIVLTRLYEDGRRAAKVQERFERAGYPRNATQVIAANGRDADALREIMRKASVSDEFAEIYAGKVAAGSGLLVVRATYKPLRAPQIAREILAGSKPLDSGIAKEESYVPDAPDPAPKVLKDHPLFLTTRPRRGAHSGGPVTAGMGFPLLSAHKERNSAIRGGAFMSRYFWPMKLVTTGRKANSAIRGGRHMSRLFWPMKLVSTRPRTLSLTRHGPILSRALSIPTLSR